MQAIILAGGFGTRLAHIVANLPKPMAPINGVPFLNYVLTYLHRQGIESVVLAVGYKRNDIIDHYGSRFSDISITYSIEDEPLGTGGAIKKALDVCTGDDVFIINGDTYFEVDLKKMGDYHKEVNGDITIATKQLEKFDRYGTVNSQNGRIIRFMEKQYLDVGRINGGIYVMKKDIFNNFDRSKFSFEKDFLETELERLKIMEYPADGYFIDIGVPADYERAQTELVKFI